MRLERELLRGVAPHLLLHLIGDDQLLAAVIVERLVRRCPQVRNAGEGVAFALLYHLKAKRLVAAERDGSASPERRLYSLTVKGQRQRQRTATLADAIGAAG